MGIGIKHGDGVYIDVAKVAKSYEYGAKPLPYYSLDGIMVSGLFFVQFYVYEGNPDLDSLKSSIGHVLLIGSLGSEPKMAMLGTLHAVDSYADNQNRVAVYVHGIWVCNKLGPMPDNLAGMRDVVAYDLSSLTSASGGTGLLRAVNIS